MNVSSALSRSPGAASRRAILKRASRWVMAVREDLLCVASMGFAMFATDVLRALIRPGLFWASEGFMLCLAVLGLMRLVQDFVGARAVSGDSEEDR